MDAGLRKPGRFAGPVRAGLELSGSGEPALAADFSGEFPKVEGARARFDANVAALRLARAIDAAGRHATAEEQQTLAAFTGWGGLASVFRDEAKRAQLTDILGEDGLASASRATLTQYYTPEPIAQALWEGLSEAGFESGRVLEPGSGMGAFIKAAPQGAAMTGVELDRDTALIASLLYPSHEIRAEGFQDHQVSGTGLYDAAIGNVPFGDVRLSGSGDPYPYEGSIHKYFIQKALWQTRPGGMVAVVTSAYTLDEKNPALRRLIHASASEGGLGADLIGAVRLPSSTFAAAGTDVVSDVLIFRRRMPGEEPMPFDWEHARQVEIDGESFTANEYWSVHPDHVAGTLHAASGRFGPRLAVAESDEAERQPNALIARIARDARIAGKGFARRDDSIIDELPPVEIDRSRIGRLSVDEGGNIFRLDAFGQSEPVTLGRSNKAKDVEELRSLLALRDMATELVALEAATTGLSSALEAKRAELAEAYRAYTGAYGVINERTIIESTRQKRATGVDENGKEVELVDEAGDPVMETVVTGVRTKMRPATEAFSLDPDSAIVFALENYDPDTKKATEATILTRRTIRAQPRTFGAHNAQDALRICLGELGRVDVAHMAYLLGETDTAAVEAELSAGLAYRDPAKDGVWVSAAEYLSGNVREKLAQAEAAAQADARYGQNVDVLTSVQPADIPLTEVEIAPGAPWISVADHLQFFREAMLLNPDDDRATLSFDSVTGRWHAVTGGARKGTGYGDLDHGWVKAGEKSSSALLDLALNNGDPRVYLPEKTDGRRVLDPVKTQEVMDGLERLREEFADWVWRDPERVDRLTRSYNDMFNNLVARSYEREGELLALPGLSEAFTPHPWQKAAVARILAEPSTGLFHEVGAGKTLTMVMAAMEMKRLGQVSKPMFVVPNHMVEQFRNEWLQAYPAARILVGNAVTNEEGRRLFVARAAAEDWDGVIVSQYAFGALGVGKDVEKAYIDERKRMITQARDYMEALGETTSVAGHEKSLANAETFLSRAEGIPSDTGLTFEETGVDFLFVDEAHAYKNLDVSRFMGFAAQGSKSLTGELSGAGSARARDLDKKLMYLRQRDGDGKSVVLATATPIANTIAEMHTMLHYLRPDLLEQAGVASFPAWLNTFAQKSTSPELSPTGSWRTVQRFDRFHNMPELMQMWALAGDVKLARDLDLAVPDIARNSEGVRTAEVVTVDAGAPLRSFMEGIDRRNDLIRSGAVPPSEDNMLKLSSDARHASLDLRAYSAMDGREEAGVGEQTKVHEAAVRIAEIYFETRSNEYTDALGKVSETKGALQTVFCDLSTPKEGRWNVYGALKAELVGLGVPENSIVMVHEAKTNAEKENLFARARSGEIAVLMGSTEKMGTGTNIQKRLVAQHHLDVPWRPCDVTQRDGRIVRQGNENKEVRIYRYVTLASFDAYMWQTVERKAKIIDQVMGYDPSVGRSIEDPGEEVAEYARTKALATGDERYVTLATLEMERSRLSARSKGWDRSTFDAAKRLEAVNREIGDKRQAIDRISAYVERIADTRGDAFNASIDGRELASRQDAGRALVEIAHHALDDRRRSLRRSAASALSAYSWQARTIVIGGVPVTPVAIRRVGLADAEAVFQIGQSGRELDAGWENREIPCRTITWKTVEAGWNAIDQRQEFDFSRLVVSLEQTIRNLPETRERLEGEISDLEASAAELAERAATPFPQLAHLERVRSEHAELTSQIALGNLEAELSESLEFPDEHRGFYEGMAAWPASRSLPIAGLANASLDEGVATHYFAHAAIVASYRGENGEHWHVAGYSTSSGHAIGFAERNGTVRIENIDLPALERAASPDGHPAVFRTEPPSRPTPEGHPVGPIGRALWSQLALADYNSELEVDGIGTALPHVEDNLAAYARDAAEAGHDTLAAPDGSQKDAIFAPLHAAAPEAEAVRIGISRFLDRFQGQYGPDLLRVAKHEHALALTAESLSNPETENAPAKDEQMAQTNKPSQPRPDESRVAELDEIIDAADRRIKAADAKIGEAEAKLGQTRTGFKEFETEAKGRYATIEERAGGAEELDAYLDTPEGHTDMLQLEADGIAHDQFLDDIGTLEQAIEETRSERSRAIGERNEVATERAELLGEEPPARITDPDRAADLDNKIATLEREQASWSQLAEREGPGPHEYVTPDGQEVTHDGPGPAGQEVERLDRQIADLKDERDMIAADAPAHKPHPDEAGWDRTRSLAARFAEERERRTERFGAPESHFGDTGIDEAIAVAIRDGLESDADYRALADAYRLQQAEERQEQRREQAADQPQPVAQPAPEPAPASVPEHQSLATVANPVIDAQQKVAGLVAEGWAKGEEAGSAEIGGYGVSWVVSDADDDDLYFIVSTVPDDPEIAGIEQALHFHLDWADERTPLAETATWPDISYRFADETGWDEDETYTVLWAPDAAGRRVEAETAGGLLEGGAVPELVDDLLARREHKRAEYGRLERERDGLAEQLAQLHAMPEAPWLAAAVEDVASKLAQAQEALEQAAQPPAPAEEPAPEKASPFGPLAAPDLLATDHLGMDAIVVAHLFAGSQDWYIVEYGEAEQEAFGYVDLGLGAFELGTFSVAELAELRDERGYAIERDAYWKPMTLAETETYHRSRHANDADPRLAEVPQPLHESFEKVQGYEATAIELEAADEGRIDMSDVDVPTWETLGERYDGEGFSIRRHVDHDPLTLGTPFWEGVEGWRATPERTDDFDDLPKEPAEEDFCAKYVSGQGKESWGIWDASVAVGDHVFVRAWVTDAPGNSEWRGIDLTELHAQRPALRQEETGWASQLAEHEAQIAALTRAQASIGEAATLAPAEIDGIARGACTRIADGIEVAQYGEDTYTFCAYEANQRLPFAAREPIGPDGIAAYRDMDNERAELYRSSTGTPAKGRSAALAGTGQAARALLLATPSDIAFCDSVQPDWRTLLANSGVSVWTQGLMEMIQRKEPNAFAVEDFTPEARIETPDEEVARQAQERLEQYRQAAATQQTMNGPSGPTL